MIAWVVGASGTWGRAVAADLAGRGYEVVALGRHSPDGATLIRVDLAGDTQPAVEAPVRAALADCVPDVLVACSAATGLDREASARANYLAPAAIVEAVVGAMRERGRGRVGVFLGQNARLGLAGVGEFSAPQGALWTWCESLQADLAAGRSPVTITRVIPPRAASETQRWLAMRSGHSAKLHEPDARRLVDAILAGRRRAGRRPVLAALAMVAR